MRYRLWPTLRWQNSHWIPASLTCTVCEKAMGCSGPSAPKPNIGVDHQARSINMATNTTTTIITSPPRASGHILRLGLIRINSCPRLLTFQACLPRDGRPPGDLQKRNYPRNLFASGSAACIPTQHIFAPTRPTTIKADFSGRPGSYPVSVINVVEHARVIYCPDHEEHGQPDEDNHTHIHGSSELQEIFR